MRVMNEQAQRGEHDITEYKRVCSYRLHATLPLRPRSPYTNRATDSSVFIKACAYCIHNDAKLRSLLITAMRRIDQGRLKNNLIILFVDFAESPMVDGVATSVN